TFPVRGSRWDWPSSARKPRRSAFRSNPNCGNGTKQWRVGPMQPGSGVGVLRTFVALGTLGMCHGRKYATKDQQLKCGSPVTPGVVILSQLASEQSPRAEHGVGDPASPGELAPVFDAMLTNAVRICEAKFGVLFRYDGNVFQPAATLGLPPAYAEFLQERGS